MVVDVREYGATGDGVTDDTADHDRAAHLEAAIRLALHRLRPYVDVHPYLATVVDTLRAAVDDE